MIVLWLEIHDVFFWYFLLINSVIDVFFWYFLLINSVISGVTAYNVDFVEKVVVIHRGE